MDEILFSELFQKTLQGLEVSTSCELEEETKGQYLSERWRSERSKRISSTYFKDVADRRIITSCSNLV